MMLPPDSQLSRFVTADLFQANGVCHRIDLHLEDTK
jgi:hypothetical protein